MAHRNKFSTTTNTKYIKQKKKQQKLEQDWTYECNKLEKRYDVIEKQLQSIYRDGNPLSLEFKDIFDWNQLMHQHRMKESKQLQTNLAETSNLVNKFQTMLHNIAKNEKFLKEMNSIAEQIEDKLMAFKTNHQKQLKELENAENILWTELCTTKERLNTFKNDINVSSMTNDNKSELISSTTKFAKKRKINKSAKFGVEHDSRPTKLIEIQQQIDEHGPYGGWPQRDHDDFLKLYQQIPSDRKLLHRLSEVMPQYTLSELREHLEWFDQYERLWEQKRIIVMKYRKQKQHEKEMKNEYESKQEEVDVEAEEKRKKREKLEREHKKKMVQEWKKEKEKREREKMRLKEEGLRRKQLKSQRECKQRLRESKRLLAELAEKKKLNELVEKQKLLQRKNRHLRVMKETERNEKLLIKFRTKDMLLVEKKKAALQKKEKEERDREWKLVNLIAKSQPDIKVKKDPSRLLKMTTATKKRIEMKKKDEKKNSKLFAYTNQASTRSTPSWRRGL